MVVLRGYLKPGAYWRSHHPSSHLPPDLELGILLRQCDTLHAQSLPPGVVPGTAVLDAGFEFLGSGITMQHHSSGLVDLDNQDVANALHFEEFSKLWFQDPRFHYAGESVVPTDEAFSAASAQFMERLTAARGARTPHAFEQEEHARTAALRTARRVGFPTGTVRRDTKPNGIQWVGDRHLIIPLLNLGAVLVVDAQTRLCRALVGTGRSNTLLTAAGFSSSPDEAPTLVACGGLDDMISIWDGRGGRTATAERSALAAGPSLGSTKSVQRCSMSAPLGVEMAAVGVRAGPYTRLADATPPLTTLCGHVGYIAALAFEPTTRGAQLLSGSGDGTARVWDVPSAKMVMALLGHQGDITSLTCAGPHLACTTSTDGTCRLWDVRSGACERLFVMSNNSKQFAGRRSLEDGDVCADGTLIAALAQDGKVGVFDVRGYAAVAEWRAPPQSSPGSWTHTRNAIAFVAGGRQVALASDRGVVGAFDSFSGDGQGAHGRKAVEFGELLGNDDAWLRCDRNNRCVGIAARFGGKASPSGEPQHQLASLMVDGSLALWSWK